MATDELAEIDGHKPKVLLADGQGREVKSTSSTGAMYKIKRTQDSYYCHCPAWRNQKGVPVNARTCKHLRDVLGDEYETARLELKNPNGAPAGKGASKVPSTSKPASRGKRKRDDDDDEDEDDEEDEEDDAPSPKKGRKVVSKSKKPDSDFDEEDESEEEPPQKKARNKSKGKKKADSDSGEDSEEKPRKKTPRKAAASKPKSKGKKKADSDSGEESDAEPRAKKSATKGKGKKKARSDSDDDSDERPAKKMKPASKGKGKKKADSDDDEDERPAKKSKPASKAKGRKKPDSDDEDEDDERPAKKSKPVSKSKGKKKADSDDDDERPAKKSKPASKAKGKKKPDSDDEDEDDERPAKKMKPTSKGKGTKVESDSEGEDEDEDVKPPKKSPTSDVKGTSKSSDPLAEIDGHKPKVLLDDGEDREIQSMSSNSTYKVKRTWDHYYCQCPAWRNQAGSPVDARTCKHLRDLLGDAYEAARIKWKNPNGPPLKPASKKGKAKSKPASKGKRKRDDDDDDDDEDDKKPKSKSKRAKVDEDDDDDDEDDSGGKKVPALLLANKWDIETGPDPTGWWISEKLDGVRTFYDGEGMVSRLGNPFTPPQWFLDKLPTDVTLDGELFGGRGKFQDTVSIVKTMNSPHWKGITFQIFDVPSENTVFEDRVAFLQKLFGPGGKYECPEVVLVEHEKAKSRKHVLEKLKEIEELGGEGLMLRRAGSKYEGKRSGTLLKIKTFYDGEAEVTGYTDGKGKHVGLTGALKCKMESGKTFNVGTGLSDKQRKNPPKIGSIITYRFQELTRDGVPRFPSYIGEAIDKKRAKDAKLPAHRKTGAKKDD